MYDFTRIKFQALPFRRKHKKCAELLRRLYVNLLAQKEWAHDWEVYQQLLAWMHEAIPENPTIKSVADRCHWHQKQAQVCQKEHRLLPSVRQTDRAQGAAPWPIAIYLDRLRSAHNIGSIVRTVEAFALGSIYFSAETPFITHKQVQDTSMGSHQWVSCHQGSELSSLPRPIIALETSNEALPLHSFIFPSAFTLVVGNEEYGCSDETLKLADNLVEIPLRGRKNSLNVANAFAIAAWEINRQKCSNV